MSELIGAELDAAVARLEGWTAATFDDPAIRLVAEMGGPREPADLNYSTSWALAGPIIERERIVLWPCAGGKEWTAAIGMGTLDFDTSPTPLIAAMRAFVASKAQHT